MQTTIVILLVAASAGWMGLMAYRFLRPKPGGKACAGGCCDGHEKPAVQVGAATGKTMMISSDDLRARVAARRK